MKAGYVRTIDGNRVMRPQTGYCKSPLHPGFLTSRLIKHKRCIEKKCKNLRVLSESGYWDAEERRKAAARERREARKEKIREWTK